MWSNELELIFLNMYRAEPVLWDPTHIYHKDKKYIHDAWARISQQLNTPITELKKKKESLMATFRSHVRKVKASQECGEDLYKPVWFAFELMQSFLGDIFKCKVKKEIQNEELSTNEEDSDSQPNYDIEEDKHIVQVQIENSSMMPQQPQHRRKMFPGLQDAKRTMKEALNTLNEALSKRSFEEDECELYGRMLAKKLRRLPESERIDFMYEIDGSFIQRISKQ